MTIPRPVAPRVNHVPRIRMGQPLASRVSAGLPATRRFTIAVMRANALRTATQQAAAHPVRLVRPSPVAARPAQLACAAGAAPEHKSCVMALASTQMRLVTHNVLRVRITAMAFVCSTTARLLAVQSVFHVPNHWERRAMPAPPGEPARSLVDQDITHAGIAALPTTTPPHVARCARNARRILMVRRSAAVEAAAFVAILAGIVATGSA